jgi:hypothetical protein
MKRAWALVALAGCASAHRPRPAMPQCTAATQPGVTSRALTWNGNGWASVIADGPTLYLREFNLDGTSRGDRIALVDEPSTPARVALTWSDGTYYVTVAPHQGSSPPRVFRVVSGRADSEAFALDAPVSGELAMVPRDASKPAALFAESDGATTLRLVTVDGEPGTPRRCPDGVQPRSVIAWRSGFRAVITTVDPATGEGRALDVAALDDACELVWRTRVWEGPLRGRAHALAVDESGAVAAFDARDGGTLIAAVDHEGAVRVRARRMERNTRDPQVFVQTDARGRRLGVQVLAVRTLETGDQLEAWRLGPDGLLRETRALTTSPDVQIRVSAADPWGGGLVAFTRAEGARGSVVAALFARVCP